MRAGWWLVLCFCLCVPNLKASRVEFITLLDGKRLAGSEICFFRGADDARSPASLFLASDDVRCVSADDVLDMPRRAWNFYARNSSLVSARGDLPAEVIVVTALNHPLFVTRHPALTDEDLLIPVPAGVPRAFTVEISQALSVRSAWFTLAIGDVAIPVESLAAHLTSMGLMGRVDDGGPARVTGILESAPVSVIAVLGTYPEPASVDDLFLQPQFASLRTSMLVPADGRVIFGR
jgi:hypothetical protein